MGSSRSRRARGWLQSAPRMSAVVMVLVVVFSSSPCCQSLQTGGPNEPASDLEFISNKGDKNIKGVSGLEKDVDDPQGVYFKKEPAQRLSSSLALEGDEESSGQTSDNAADISPSRGKRDVEGTGRRGNVRDQAPRRRRQKMVSKWDRSHAALSSTQSSSSALSSSAPDVNRQRERREAGLFTSPADKPRRAGRSVRSNLAYDTDGKGMSRRQRTGGRLLLQRLSRARTSLARATGSSRRRRDITHQRPPRQAEDDADDFGDEDDSDDDDDDDEDDMDKKRKKRAFSPLQHQGPKAVPRQRNTLSSTEREKRQSDDDDDDDDGDDDDDDDADDLDIAGDKRRKRKRETGTRPSKENQHLPVRNKRQNSVLETIEVDSEDDDDDDDDNDEDQEDSDDMADGLELGLARRKRQYFPLKRVLREQPSDADDDDDDEDEREDKSDDTLKNALADMLDEMVDNSEEIPGPALRRKRSVSGSGEGHRPGLPRSRRSSDAIRQIIQETADEEDDDDDNTDFEDTIIPDDLVSRKKRSNFQVEPEHYLSKREFEDLSELVGNMDESSEDDATDAEVEDTKLTDIALDMAAESITGDDYNDDSEESSVTPVLKARRHINQKQPRHQREVQNGKVLHKVRPGPTAQRADQIVPRLRKRKSVESRKLPEDVNDSDGLNIPLNHHSSSDSSGEAVLPAVSFPSSNRGKSPMSGPPGISNKASTKKESNDESPMADKENEVTAGSSQTTKQSVRPPSSTSNESSTIVNNQTVPNDLSISQDSSSSRKNKLPSPKKTSITNEEILNTGNVSEPPTSESASTSSAIRKEDKTTTETEPQANASELLTGSRLLNVTKNSSSENENALKGTPDLSPQKKGKRSILHQSSIARKLNPKEPYSKEDKSAFGYTVLRKRRSINNHVRKRSTRKLPKQIVVIQPAFEPADMQSPDVVTKYKDADRTLEDILDNVLGPVPNPVPTPVQAQILVAPGDDDDDDDDDNNDDIDAANMVQLSQNEKPPGFIALTAMGKIKSEKEKAQNKLRLEKVKAQTMLRKEKNKAKQALQEEREKAQSQLSLEKKKAKDELRQEEQKAKLSLKEAERKAKKRIQEMLDYPSRRFARDVSTDLENELKDVIKDVHPKNTTKETADKERDHTGFLTHNHHITSYPAKEDNMSWKLTNKTLTASAKLSNKQKEQIVAETAYDIDQAVHKVLQHMTENIRKSRNNGQGVMKELFQSDTGKQQNDDHKDTDKHRRSTDGMASSNHKTEHEIQKQRSSQVDYSDDNGEVFEDLEYETDEELLDKKDLQLTKRRSANGFHEMSEYSKRSANGPLGDPDDDDDEELDEEDKKESLPEDTTTDIKVNKVGSDGKNKEEELDEALVFEEEDEDGPNSGYTQWTEWGACSVTCGIGRRQRSRTCEDQGGCHSGNVEEDVCMMEKCQAIPV